MEAEALDQILGARHAAMDGQRPAAVAAMHAAGALTARERLDALVDAATLVEYGVLAGAAGHDDGSDDDPSDTAADGLVAGAGLVDGRPVVVASYDRAVRGGTQSDRNTRKLNRLIYLANQHRWPFVCFVDGDGARPGDPLAPPPIAVGPRGRWDLYEGLAELSGWAPSVAIVSGRALDGNAGLAMLADCVIATADATLRRPRRRDHHGTFGPGVRAGRAHRRGGRRRGGGDLRSPPLPSLPRR